MNDPRRTLVSGPAVPMRGNDIDTDRIIPARFLKCVVFDGLGQHAFADDRAQRRERGDTHAFDHPRHADGVVLLVNRNFGCGSSREHAPQALRRWGRGIRAIVGESFAEIFAGNCLALGIPCPTVAADDMARLMDLAETRPETDFHVDLERLELRAGPLTVRLAMPEGPRGQLLAGTWDSTAELLADREAIAATAKRLPYANHWR